MAINTLIGLVVFGFIGYLVATYIPMIEPVKTIVIVAFVVVAIYYALRLLGGFPAIQ